MILRVLSKKPKISYLLLNCCPKRGQKLLNESNCRNLSVDFESYSKALFKVSQSIAASDAVKATKDTMISLHEWTGMSWSVEIALITFTVRALITFPLTVSQQQILAKYEALKPEINHFGDRLKKEIDSVRYLYGWSALKAKLMHTFRMKQEMKRLIIRDNCHPMKASIVVWFQIPIWILFSHSIRNMCFGYPLVDQNSGLVFKQLSNEGMLWFPDLTQTDPYFVLPFITAFINLTIVELHSKERLKKLGTKTTMHSMVTNLGRGLCLVLIPIGLQMPSAVCFYWLTSSSVGLMQNLILKTNYFKQFVNKNKINVK